MEIFAKTQKLMQEKSSGTLRHFQQSNPLPFEIFE